MENIEVRQATDALPTGSSSLTRCLMPSRRVDNEQDPNLLQGINYPGSHDVMLGRGGESTYHTGNITFRKLVEDHKDKYYGAPRSSKSSVVAEVVRKWRSMDPPGRFLTRTHPGSGEDSSWHDVGDRRALKKSSHSLRDSVRCISIEKKKWEGEGVGLTGLHSVSEDDTLEIRCFSKNVPDRRKRGIPDNAALLPLLISSGFKALQKNENDGITAPPSKKRRVAYDEREEVEDDPRQHDTSDNEYHGISATTATLRHAMSADCRDRLESNPSPCGSADWFSSLGGGMPVQQPTQSLPFASCLIGELAVPGEDDDCLSDDDDVSLGQLFSSSPRATLAVASIAAIQTVEFVVHRPIGLHSASNSETREE